MIAALALLAVPATLYTINPDFTCENCDEPFEEDYENFEYSNQVDSDSGSESDNDSIKLNTNEISKPTIESINKNDRLIQAANEFIRQEEPTKITTDIPKKILSNNTSPKNKDDLSRYSTNGAAPSSESIHSTFPTSTVQILSPVSNTPLQPINTISPPKQSISTPTTPYITDTNGSNNNSNKKDEHPRSNSAYRLRLEHQQQQQALAQQHQEYLQKLQNIRNSSPIRMKPFTPSGTPPGVASGTPSGVAS